MRGLITNPRALREHISEALMKKASAGWIPEDVFLSPVTSSVLFLLGGHCKRAFRGLRRLQQAVFQGAATRRFCAFLEKSGSAP